MSEPIINDELRAQIDEVKKLWSNTSLFGRIRACIRLPFIIARDILHKTWELLTKPIF